MKNREINQINVLVNLIFSLIGFFFIVIAGLFKLLNIPEFFTDLILSLGSNLFVVSVVFYFTFAFRQDKGNTLSTEVQMSTHKIISASPRTTSSNATPVFSNGQFFQLVDTQTEQET